VTPGLRVLLVEDNRANAQLAVDLLELEGHVVELCGNAAALRRRLGAGPVPDVVLMDILLPDADGVVLLEELRRLPRWADVPAMAVTAQVSRDDAERYARAGFDRVMTKPIDTRAFVAEVLGLARRRTE